MISLVSKPKAPYDGRDWMLKGAPLVLCTRASSNNDVARCTARLPMSCTYCKWFVSVSNTNAMTRMRSNSNNACCRITTAMTQDVVEYLRNDATSKHDMNTNNNNINNNKHRKP